MIYIVSHKNIELPVLEGYKPIQVGNAEENFAGFARDNTGDNIAEKNANYCELTALYWIWKNTDDEYKGLAHYRRFFGKRPYSSRFSDVLSGTELKQVLDGAYDPLAAKPGMKAATFIGGALVRGSRKPADIILADPVHYHVNAKAQLLRSSCSEKTFDALRKIISEEEPAYLAEFDRFFGENKASLYNMMYCRKEVFDAYCAWLFPLLEKMEKEIDPSEMNNYQRRVYGFLAERLLNIWVRKNQLRVTTLPVVNTGYTLRDTLRYARRDFTNRVRFRLTGGKK